MSVFFNLHVVSKSPSEISPPIGAVFGIANLPCLVKLAPSLLWDKEPVQALKHSKWIRLGPDIPGMVSQFA